MIIKSIGKVCSDIQWDSLRKSPWWFINIHIPYIVKAFTQSFYLPLHKNIMYNHKIWDGQTSNDFKVGHLIEFVYKLGGIGRLPYVEDDGRGYFIGYLDEDEI